MLIQQGWDIEKAQSVAVLYEEAFGAKFSRVIPNKSSRIEVLSMGFLPEFSFSAMANNEVMGIAGFHVADGSLTGGMGASQLIEHLGFFHGLRACALFSLFERTPKEKELVMDGIAVSSLCRGQGIGSRLLDQIIQYAVENHFETVRLDVIDSNPRAKKLYESKGFVAVATESYPYLKWLIGFSGSTTMELKIKGGYAR